MKVKLENCYLDGFYLDRNTFLKADSVGLVMVPRREGSGKAADKPMIILKNVVEMTLDHRGKIVVVENKPQLGVWVDALEHALERFNQSSDLTSAPASVKALHDR